MQEPVRSGPQHASAGMAVALLIIGGALCVVAFASTQVHLGWGAVGMAMLLGALWLWRSGDAVRLLNTARTLGSAGRHAEAGALLDAAIARHGWLVGRNVELQRALIRWSQADVEGTIAHATRTIEGGGARWNARSWLDAAFGLRALACAVQGSADAARKDIQTLAERQPARPEPLAYAELARAVVLYREGSTEELRQHLSSNCWLLFEHLGLRERLLARALWRGAYSPDRATQDAGAAPGDAGEPLQASAVGGGPREAERSSQSPAVDAGLVEWASRLLPDLASYVCDAQREAVTSSSETSESSIRPTERSGRKQQKEPADKARQGHTKAAANEGSAPSDSERNRSRSPAFWRAVAAVGAFGMLLIGSLTMARRPSESGREHQAPVNVSAAPSSEQAARSVVPESTAAAADKKSSKYAYLIVGAAFLLLAGWMATARSRQARLNSARLKLAQGDLAGAEGELVRLCAAGNPLLRVVAMLELARVADRRADFALSLSLCDKAIAVLTRARLGASDRLGADLQALRAHAKLLLDGEGGGVDALPAVIIMRSSPTGKDTILRARVLEPARCGEWSAARKVSVTHAQTERIDPRTTFVIDAVSALAADEREQLSELRSLLADWKVGADWLARAAPRLHAELTAHSSKTPPKPKRSRAAQSS